MHVFVFCRSKWNQIQPRWSHLLWRRRLPWPKRRILQPARFLGECFGMASNDSPNSRWECADLFGEIGSRRIYMFVIEIQLQPKSIESNESTTPLVAYSFAACIKRSAAHNVLCKANFAMHLACKPKWQSWWFESTRLCLGGVLCGFLWTRPVCRGFPQTNYSTKKKLVHKQWAHKPFCTELWVVETLEFSRLPPS